MIKIQPIGQTLPNAGGMMKQDYKASPQARKAVLGNMMMGRNRGQGRTRPSVMPRKRPVMQIPRTSINV